MQDLIKQEQFELEALDRLNSGKFLNSLVFGGGTMLRLCFALNRFSVDLDFWIAKETDPGRLFKELKENLTQFYTVKDAADKFNMLLFEIQSKDYPRSLKIEIRKEVKKIATEQAIAYSAHSTAQVIVRVVSLPDMMQSKIEAFLDRKEIRDVFDIEFLAKKNVPFGAPSETLARVLKGIEALTKKDYTVKLGSLLEEEQREYYLTGNFKILKRAIQEALEKSGGLQ